MIRPAVVADVPHLLHFIRELARYERLEHEVDLDAGRLAEHLFGPHPKAEALLAEEAGRPVGFALYFTAYSTFRIRPFLHLEDLFVLEQERGRGHGLALLRAVAAVAVARGYPRLVWNVLEWNAPAIGFYRAHGAVLLPDWRTCRLTGPELTALAAGG